MQSLEELPFIAGHVALDFVNTAEERGRPEAGDVLRTPADLGLWGQRYGLLSPHVREDRSELRRALGVRELLYAAECGGHRARFLAWLRRSVKLKPGVRLINAARGGIYEEDAG